ncbi:hypothetical protein, partial [Gordonia sp. (in: high G+C Gram-positive bacteria)]|uniref:hypothetical protein n=1 Tax=Gordonia sp. (in: high G+C Gram-positive bacteria) TaxID=84139 RepID=UPI003C73B26F
MHSHADDLDTVLDTLGLTKADLYDEPRGKGERPQPKPLTPEQLERRRKRAEMDAAHADERGRELAEASRVAAEALLGDRAAEPGLVEVIARRLDAVPDPVEQPPADEDGKKRSVAALLVDRALTRYRLGLS